MSSSRKSVWLLVFLLPIAAGVGWYNYHKFAEARLEDSEFDASYAASQSKEHWKYKTEEHWLVDETARDITEMLAFAAKGQSGGVELQVTFPPKTHQSYDLAAKVHRTDVNAHLEWKDYIWSPAEIAPWVQKLVGALHLTASHSTEDDAVIQALTNPTPEVMEREAKRISDALTKSPLDSNLHAQAALVTAAFALREEAGHYSDIRREICRTTAHLAIAQTLQPENSGVLRKLADAALQTLAEREAPAQAELAKLANHTTPGVAAWVRALQMHNTADWRELAAEPTLLEELENCLARTRSVDPDFAFNWLSKRKPAPIHAWRRILLLGHTSVDLGHRFAKQSVGQEINSLQADWALFFGKKIPDSDILKALNEPAGRSVGKRADGTEGIQVLAWDMWSAQHQRYLCAAMHNTIEFFRDRWGVPEYRDVQKYFRKNFSGLALLPLIEREMTEDRSEIPEISKRVSELIANHPEVIPPPVWGDLRQDERKTHALSVADPQPWFVPALPFGTTYDICARSGCIHVPVKNDSAWWDNTMRLAPVSYDALYLKLWTFYGKTIPADVAETTSAPLRPYSLWALREILHAQEMSKSPKYAETLKEACQFDPDRYFTLGDYYVALDQPEQAVDAYQKGVDLCTDRVMVANSCAWLVDYLDDHEQSQKAQAIASEAAEVYSYGGLATMARLKEKHGDLKGAQDYWGKIVERYNHPEELDAFYVRNRDKDPRYKEIADRQEKKLFPAGLEKVSLADLKTPPEDGVSVTTTSHKSAAMNVRAGDVVVAIDGIRVHDEEQYYFARALKIDPRFQLIVWNRGSGYHEVNANIPGRRFGVDLADYRKK